MMHGPPKEIIMNKASKQYVRIAAVLITLIFTATLTASPALSRDRYSYRNKLRGYHHVRVVNDNNVLPALIATGILAGITLSIIDSASNSRSSRCYRTARSSVNIPQTGINSHNFSTGSVVVTAQLLNVRSGPSLRDYAILQVPNGTVLSVHGTTAGWYYVKTTDNLYGWVMMQYTAPLGYSGAG
jgi:hypothetical protein